MRKFLVGFAAGLASYHYVSGGFQNEELVSEMRSMIKKLDDRLAGDEKTDMTQDTSSPLQETPPSPAA